MPSGRLMEVCGALALLVQLLAQNVIQDNGGQHVLGRGQGRVSSTMGPEIRQRKWGSTCFQGQGLCGGGAREPVEHAMHRRPGEDSRRGGGGSAFDPEAARTAAEAA